MGEMKNLLEPANVEKASKSARCSTSPDKVAPDASWLPNPVIAPESISHHYTAPAPANPRVPRPTAFRSNPRSVRPRMEKHL